MVDTLLLFKHFVELNWARLTFEVQARHLKMKGANTYSLRKSIKLICDQVGLKETTHHMCPQGCIVYNGDYADLEECPAEREVVRTTRTGRTVEKHVLCLEPRYKPGLDQRGQREPAGLCHFYPVDPLVDAVLGTVRGASWVRHAMADAREHWLAGGERLVRDALNGEAMRQLYDTDRRSRYPILHPYTVPVAFTSDGANLVEMRDAFGQQSAYFELCHFLFLPLELRNKTAWQWRLCVTGPRKPFKPLTFIAVAEQSFAKLEVPVYRRVALAEVDQTGPESEPPLSLVEVTNVVVILQKSDTVETASLMRAVGATGRCSCPYCYLPGAKTSTGHYAPCMLAPHVDPTKSDPRRDLWLGPGTLTDVAAVQDHDQMVLRDWRSLQHVLARLRDAPNATSRERIQGHYGVVDEPAFASLQSQTRLYPFWWTLDPMHLLWKNVFKTLADLVFDKQASRVANWTIDDAVRKQVDATHDHSRAYVPHQLWGSARSIVQKLGDYKAWELRDRMTSGFLYWALRDHVDPELCALLLVSWKLSVACTARVIDCEDEGADWATLDLARLPDAGHLAVKADEVRVGVADFLFRFESYYYKRQRDSMHGVTTPSMHRLVHLNQFFRKWGPGYSFDQDVLETTIYQKPRPAIKRRRRSGTFLA